MQNNPQLYYQLGGEAGTIQTVGMMRTLVNRAVIHPWIRQRAIRLVTWCKRNIVCEERTLTGYTNRAISFIRDPAGTEALHDPVTFYEARIRQGIKPAGDCDDMAMYLATLLKSIGHRPMFRLIDRLGTGGFHHVMVHCHGVDYDPTLSTVPDEPVAREIFYEV
jgi:hypothetical protein